MAEGQGFGAGRAELEKPVQRAAVMLAEQMRRRLRRSRELWVGAEL